METARQPAGIPAGGQFAPTGHTEPDLVLVVPEHASLGEYQVSAPALRAARDVWSAVENEPEWKRHEAAEVWAKERGYEVDTWDDYNAADQAHAGGVVLVHSWGAAVTLSGQHQRNFSVDLEGAGDSLDTGDGDGSISPVTFIYV